MTGVAGVGQGGSTTANIYSTFYGGTGAQSAGAGRDSAVFMNDDLGFGAGTAANYTTFATRNIAADNRQDLIASRLLNNTPIAASGSFRGTFAGFAADGANNDQTGAVRVRGTALIDANVAGGTATLTGAIGGLIDQNNVPVARGVHFQNATVGADAAFTATTATNVRVTDGTITSIANAGAGALAGTQGATNRVTGLAGANIILGGVVADARDGAAANRGYVAGSFLTVRQ